jgi:hypothetical protein
MIAPLFRNRKGPEFPGLLYQLAINFFSIVQHWEPPAVLPSARGRLFESVLYRYCHARRLTLTETAGSRTIRRVNSASGFRHESDGVIATPDLTVHLELKHLSAELDKNELLVFNQKGLDYLAADNDSFRSKPLYRVIVSASPLTIAARKFAVQWGILAIEPDRLPLLSLHWLAGRRVPNLDGVDEHTQMQIWREVPHLITPLQQRVVRLSGVLSNGSELVSNHRVENAMKFQLNAGKFYRIALEENDPAWLEDRYESLHRELNLDKLA